MATLYHTWVSPRKSRTSEVVSSPRTERSVSISVANMRRNKKSKSKNRPEKSVSSPFPSPKRDALVEAEAKLGADCDAISENPFERSGSPAFKTKLHCYQPREVAEELCLMDAELLRKIQAEEMEHGAWMKADKKNLAPNILAMVHASNNLAMLVPTEILAERSPQTMSKVIVHFIKIANCCYHLHNFNSLKAILAGLQCTPVYRLKKTWKEVPTKYKKKFDGLCHLMSEESNYREYRRVLDKTLDNNTPCIPFLGVLLTTIVQCSAHNYGLGSRKFSGVEDYTVMEAVTVRNRLERLRRRSSVKYSRSHLVSTGTCQVIEEESQRRNVKPSGDFATDVSILEEGVTSSSTNPNEHHSTQDILERLSVDVGQDKADDFRRRSNCLDPQIARLMPGLNGDCGAQAEKGDGSSKEEMQSESNISLALSDISLHVDSEETLTSSTSQTSADHTHMNLLEDIRLQEVKVNDQYIQEVSSADTKPMKRRRNGTIENAFTMCPSNESLCFGNGSDGISSSSFESVCIETSISDLNQFVTINSISSISSISSVGTLDRSSTPQDNEVATIDFPAESVEDPPPERTQGKSLSSRPARISRCASDHKVKPPHGVVSASIHESMSFECIRDVMKLSVYDMTEGSMMDLTSETGTLLDVPTTSLSSDDEGISAGEVDEDSESSSSSTSDLITPPPMMSSPDSVAVLSRLTSAPVGCPTEPCPMVAFSSIPKRNTWQPDQLQQMTKLSTDYHKKENKPHQIMNKVAAAKKEEEIRHDKIEEEEEEYATGPVRRRSRRKASKVLSVALAPSMKIKNWSLVLTKYQMMSLGCSNTLASQPFLRSLILKYSLNSDSQNYKLSHAREPNH